MVQPLEIDNILLGAYLSSIPGYVDYCDKFTQAQLILRDKSAALAELDKLLIDFEARVGFTLPKLQGYYYGDADLSAYIYVWYNGVKVKMTIMDIRGELRNFKKAMDKIIIKNAGSKWAFQSATPQR